MKRQDLSNIWKSVSILINIFQVASRDLLVTTIPRAPMRPGMSVKVRCPGNLGHIRIVESIEKGKQQH